MNVLLTVADPTRVRSVLEGKALWTPDEHGDQVNLNGQGNSISRKYQIPQFLAICGNARSIHKCIHFGVL